MVKSSADFFENSVEKSWFRFFWKQCGKEVSHDHRSFERNLGNCKQKPEKSGLQRGLNP